LDRERLAPTIAAARTTAGSERFDSAWASGRAESFDQVVDLAIDSVLRGPTAPQSAAVITNIATELGAAVRPAVRIRVLGHFAITVDGREVPSSAWKFARPRELLVYLLGHAEGRSREQISLAFWPDASAAQAKNNVHVTLHHLRRALGRPDIVLFERDRYVINWALGVEVDAIVFEREVESACRTIRATPHAPNAVGHLRSAVDLYHGDLLADENAGDWHLEQRDRLRRVFTDGLSALGERLVTAGSYSDAVDVYRRLVHADPWDEPAHRQLMSALARAGQRGEALRHYDRVEALLAKEFGSTPARETVELYDQLRRAGFDC